MANLLFNSTNKKHSEHKLYYRSMGKIFRVRAICDTVDEANKFCEQHDSTGVIGELGENIIIADLYGEKITTEKQR